jgi:hypothetical protein
MTPTRPRESPTDTEGTPPLITTDVANVSDIEAIKQLKARYCRHLDEKDWRAWRQLFAPDFVSEIVGAGSRRTIGADEFVAYTRRTLGKPTQVTVHHVHAPEITMTTGTTADGVWALHDIVRLLPAVSVHGYGHYHETYEKTDGQWRISSSKLTRLREDLSIPLPPRVVRWLRVRAARLARWNSRENAEDVPS